VKGHHAACNYVNSFAQNLSCQILVTKHFPIQLFRHFGAAKFQVLKGRIMNMADFWDPTNLTKIRLNHTTEHCFFCPEVGVEPG
jgi:hypothetical protein